jgi:hypothetical protein
MKKEPAKGSLCFQCGTPCQAFGLHVVEDSENLGLKRVLPMLFGRGMGRCPRLRRDCGKKYETVQNVIEAEPASRIIGKVESHPSLREITLYCDGCASSTTTNEIEQHLVYCSDCARLVAKTVRELVQELHQKRIRAAVTFE